MSPHYTESTNNIQFEVVQARLKSEYNVDSDLEPIGYTLARWADGGWDGQCIIIPICLSKVICVRINSSFSLCFTLHKTKAVDKADADGKLFGIMIVQDRWKRPVLLFRNDWKAASVAEEEKYLELKPWSKPPMFE